MVLLHLLTKRCEDLVAARTQTINRLLMDLVSGGARRNLTTKRADALLAAVSPVGEPAVIRWQLATELVADVRQLEQRIAAVEARIKTAVAQANTSLLGLFGVGPVLAATFLGEIGDIRWFQSKHHFAAHTGTAPLEASSSQVVRRATTNRRLTCMHLRSSAPPSTSSPSGPAAGRPWSSRLGPVASRFRCAPGVCRWRGSI